MDAQVGIFSSLLRKDFKYLRKQLKLKLRQYQQELLSDKVMVGLFRKRNRAALYKKCSPMFAQIRRQYPYISKMHFHLPDGSSFLRIHRPSNYGDKIARKRLMIQKIHSLRLRLVGFESGIAGLSYRMVEPVFYQDKYIGSLELGTTTDIFFQNLKKHVDSFGMLFLHKNELLAKERESDHLLGDFVLHNSDIEDKILIASLLKKLVSKNTGDIVRSGSSYYALHFFDLSNFNKDVVAKILILQDVSRFQDSYQKGLLLGVFISVILFLIAVLFLYLQLNTYHSELILSQRRNTLILNSLNEGILGQDMQGRTIFMNPAVTSLTGWTQEDLYGEHHHNILHHSKPDGSENTRDDCPINRSKNDGKIYHIDNEVFWKKDGSYFPVEYLATPIKTDKNEIEGTVIAFTDITKRKEIEHELVYAKDKAEKASLAKSRFLANMSHEMRTPLHCILGITDLLLYSDLSSEQREQVKLAKGASDHLLHLINDILDFAKTESKQGRLIKSNFNLRVLFKNLLAEFKLTLRRNGNKKLSLDFNLDDEVPPLLYGDESKLRQILYNLVGNAVKFTDQGYVRLNVFLENTEEKSPHKKAILYRLRFEIKDTGPGIPSSLETTILKSFEEEKNNTFRHKGAGFGLAISKRLIELMQGKIWLESSVGIGSTFYFTALFEEERKSSEFISDEKLENKHSSNCAEKLNGMNIFLVEDNSVNQKITQAMFAKFGVNINTANNGQDFLKKLASMNSLDIVLMDIEMPVLNGIETTNILRQDPKYNRFAKVPIIACTAHALDEEHDNFLKEGVNAVLAKPFSMQDLCAVLYQFF